MSVDANQTPATHGAKKRAGAYRLDRTDLVQLTILFTLIIVRCVLAHFEPLGFIPGAIADDALMTRGMDNILAGSWLGPYDYLTLLKNPGYPMLLALGSALHIPYGILFALFLATAALLFAIAIRPLVPSRWIRLGAFTMLLFVPSLFSHPLFQRVYRGGITVVLTIMVIASYLGLILRVREGAARLVPWTTCAVLSLPCFYIMKEDSIWIAPVIGAACIIALVEAVLARRGEPTPTRVALVACTLSCTLMPIIALFGTTALISRVNEAHYGVAVVTEKVGGPFSEVYRDLTMVDTGSHDRLVAIPRPAVDAALAASPTLNSISPQLKKSLDDQLNYWRTINPELTEIPMDHVQWALLDALNATGGCRDAVSARNFWQSVHDELQAAFDAGNLPRRSGCASLSAVTAPLYPGDLPSWISNALRSTIELLVSPRTGVLAASTDGSPEEQIRVGSRLHARVLVSGANPPHTTYEGVAIETASRLISIQGILTCALVIAGIAGIAFLARRGRLRKGGRGATLMTVYAGLMLAAFEVQLLVEWAYPRGLYPVAEGSPYFYGAATIPLVWMASMLVATRALQTLRDERDHLAS